ncbi:MAG: zinc-ribbon domain-containing protein [Lachnospiraceae bacterium]|nr:zinc-ribbon domain-containing protein [Lachnospiraceae bacterium]
MRFCDECGAQLEDNAVFCDECGAKVESATVVAADIIDDNSENVSGENKTNEKRTGGNRGTKITIIALSLLLCGAVAVIIMLWKDKEPTTQSVNKESETQAPVFETSVPKEPVTIAPTTEVPSDKEPVKTEGVKTEAPQTKVPETTPPTTKEPEKTESPTTKVPATKAPATKAPATKAPATKAPATKAPATKAPATKAPATKAPSVKKVYALLSKTVSDEYGNLMKKSQYSYNAKGQLATETLTIPGGAENSGTYESKFDAYGNVIETTWYGINGEYIYKKYCEYEYDKNHNIITESYYYVDEVNFFGYEADGYFEYTYDSNNNLTEEYMITNGRYLGRNAYYYYYDENNVMLYKSCYAGDNLDEYYELAYEDFYEYDEKGRIICVERRLNDELITRTNITFDDKGNVLKETIYYGDTKEQTIIEYKYGWTK